MTGDSFLTKPTALQSADHIRHCRDYDLAYIHTGHDELAENELRRLHQCDLALTEWHEKTEWIQTSATPEELGHHRADVLKRRIDKQRKLLEAVLEAHRADSDPAWECESVRPKVHYAVAAIAAFLEGSK